MGGQGRLVSHVTLVLAQVCIEALMKANETTPFINELSSAGFVSTDHLTERGLVCFTSNSGQ